MIVGIIDIMTLVLIAALGIYVRIIENSDSKRIDKMHDDIHNLQDLRWSTSDKIHDLRVELKYNRNRGDRLENDMEALAEALHMQGIATVVKTEEVKVLVKPEDTDGEDTDN